MYIYFIIGSLLVMYMVRTLRRNGRKVPGPKGWPIIGMLFEVKPENMHTTTENYAKEFREIMSFDLLGKQIVFINSERLMRKAFAEEPAKFVLNDRPELYGPKTFLNNSKSMGFYLQGFSSTHDLLRKAFAKGFHVYGDGITVFEEKVQTEIRNLIGRIMEHNGEEFDVVALIRTSIVNLMSIFLRGHGTEEHEEDIILEYIRAANLVLTPAIDTVLLKFPFMRFMPGVFKNVHDQLRRSHGKLLKTFFVEQRNTYSEDETRGLIDVLLDQQRKENNDTASAIFSDEIIEGTIFDAILAGTSTSIFSLSSMILCLAHHPGVQRKARQEIHAVIGSDRPPTLQDKAKCPYIEALFMETQRYITIAPFTGPHTNREEIEFEGFIIPKNTLILGNIWFLHHDEKVWGDPWTFRPERFLDDQGQLLPRTHQVFKNALPFGVGRRQCAGEVFARSRIFIYITSLLQRWTFIPSRDRCGSCDPRSDQFETKFVTEPKPFFCRVIQN